MPPAIFAPVVGRTSPSLTCRRATRFPGEASLFSRAQAAAPAVEIRGSFLFGASRCECPAIPCDGFFIPRPFVDSEGVTRGDGLGSRRTVEGSLKPLIIPSIVASPCFKCGVFRGPLPSCLRGAASSDWRVLMFDPHLRGASPSRRRGRRAMGSSSSSP